MSVVYADFGVMTVSTGFLGAGKSSSANVSAGCEATVMIVICGDGKGRYMIMLCYSALTAGGGSSSDILGTWEPVFRVDVDDSVMMPFDTEEPVM